MYNQEENRAAQGNTVESVSEVQVQQSLPPEFPVEPATASGISYVTGLLGALFGALVGVIPWFLASTFLNFFIGYLGFLVGFASFFGYKLFRGARKSGYALAVVMICSIFALIFAEYLSCFYNVWTFYVEELAAEGITLANVYMDKFVKLCFEATTEVIFSSDVIVGLLFGLAIGILGIVSVRKQIGAYVLPQYVPQQYIPSEMPAQQFATQYIPSEMPEQQFPQYSQQTTEAQTEHVESPDMSAEASNADKTDDMSE